MIATAPQLHPQIIVLFATLILSIVLMFLNHRDYNKARRALQDENTQMRRKLFEQNLRLEILNKPQTFFEYRHNRLMPTQLLSDHYAELLAKEERIHAIAERAYKLQSLFLKSAEQEKCEERLARARADQELEEERSNCQENRS